MNIKRFIVFSFASASLLFPILSFAGAWGDGSFQNDDALNWVRECVVSGNTQYISSTLDKALAAEYLEAPNGSAAVAAAEVVAAAKGRASAEFPEELQVWLNKQSKEKLQALSVLAVKTLRKVLDPKVSELKQLWSETGANRWDQGVVELEMRLRD
jgi:hypothetical protein